jgi:hypothetical protein
MEKINLNIFTPTARERFIVERDAHQIAEDATAITLLEHDLDTADHRELDPEDIFDDDDSDWDIDNEDEYENDSDPLDVCPFCQGPMTPGMAAYGMCDSCAHEQDGGEW